MSIYIFTFMPNFNLFKWRFDIERGNATACDISAVDQWYQTTGGKNTGDGSVWLSK